MSTPPHEQSGDDLLLNRHSDAEETLLARMIREGKVDAARFFREKVAAQREIIRKLTRECCELRLRVDARARDHLTAVDQRDEARAEVKQLCRRSALRSDRCERAEAELERLREGLRTLARDVVALQGDEI